MMFKTNQFDMILMLIIVLDNNFRNIIVTAAILEDETETTFTWILQELKNSCNFTSNLNLKKNFKGKLHDQFELFSCEQYLTKALYSCKSS
ncbi:hypothetical protein GLOIN_2v1775064 [Rhizophagus irregularis DAOM 181602=DAOM 197198]|nr:hypothetical protein GLOIN_2v1775064 [Rhizophagus irregularis DAOM 181602=DAOM 197198]